MEGIDYELHYVFSTSTLLCWVHYVFETSTLACCELLCALEDFKIVGVHYALSSTEYCKSTNFGVLLYLANLANCVFSLIFVTPTYVNYVDRTLHRRGRPQI